MCTLAVNAVDALAFNNKKWLRDGVCTTRIDGAVRSEVRRLAVSSISFASTLPVLRFFSRNAFVSGCVRLGATATMPTMTFPLSSEHIAARIQDPFQSMFIEVVEETGSTNADLMAALPHLQGPALRIARNQIAGRGRAGRTWVSAPGDTLTFSLAWPYTRPPHALVGLPLAVGVALADALASLSIEIALKWPNDILYNGKKLAGVLVESARVQQVDGERNWVVVGVGINVRVAPELQAQIGNTAIGIGWLADLDQSMLYGVLANHLAQALDKFDAEGLAPFVSRWNALHAFKGQAVRILDHGKVLHEGRALGIDQSGRLLLDCAGKQLSVMAGDVSLRAVN